MHSHDQEDTRERGHSHARWMFEPPFGPPGMGHWGPDGHGRGGRGAGRGGRGGRGWGRARRGDVRSAILALLAERPMHGYEIINELSDRTEGVWRPSAGSIYPTLQLLEDEGLIVGETDASGGGKRRFALTEQGRQAASEAVGPAPWDEVASGTPVSTRALLRTAATLVPVVRQVAMTGNQQDQEEAARILEETRRRLYGILAAGPSAEPTGQTD